jgi:glycosyltransferase involved in cell wall biosynthesis
MEMKAVHYTLWDIGPGGMEVGVQHYSVRFSEQHKLHVYGIRPTTQQIFDESKIEIQAGDSGKLRPYWQYFNYARQHRNAIFHLQNGGPVLLALTLLAGVRRVMYHIHGTIYWKTPIQKIYMKAAWRMARSLMANTEVTFIANSQYSANIFRNKVMPAAQPLVIYNGLDVPKFAAHKSQRSELKRIGYAGRLAIGKNVDMVIRLFEEIAGQNPKLELHLAGDGPLRRALEEQARQSPFADRIKFHGHVKDIAAFYGSVDLLVFLSAYESFGNVVAEALLTGTPTLTSNIPVFEEIYGDEKGFTLGDPKDYELIKTNFLKSVANFPELAQKAYALSNVIGEKFSIESHINQIKELYEKY